MIKSESKRRKESAKAKAKQSCAKWSSSEIKGEPHLGRSSNHSFP